MVARKKREADPRERGERSEQPNALGEGRVSRTMWPPQAGTRRWMREYGEALVCVRHREDPAGLRRVVTVELVVGPVATRTGQHRLRDAAWYPIALSTADRGLQAQLRKHGARWDAEHRHWYVRGNVVRHFGLEDRIAIRRRLSASSELPKEQSQRARPRSILP